MAHFPRLNTHKFSKALCSSLNGKEAEKLVCGTLGPVRVTPEDGADEASKKWTFNLGR